jgi:hypothetical protein
VLSEQCLEAFPSRVYLGHIHLLAVLRTHAVHVHTRNKRFSILLAMTLAHDDTEPSHFAGNATLACTPEDAPTRPGETARALNRSLPTHI